MPAGRAAILLALVTDLITHTLTHSLTLYFLQIFIICLLNDLTVILQAQRANDIILFPSDYFRLKKKKNRNRHQAELRQTETTDEEKRHGKGSNDIAQLHMELGTE